MKKIRKEAASRKVFFRLGRQTMSLLLILSLVLQESYSPALAKEAATPVLTEEENRNQEAQEDQEAQSQEDQDREEPELLEEIESRRSLYSKEYLCSDGSRQLFVYPEPVHYEDEQGRLLPIDNSLQDSGEGYKNGSNSYDLTLATGEDNGGQVVYQEDGYEISWQLVEEKEPEAGEAETGEIETEAGEAVSLYSTEEEVRKEFYTPRLEAVLTEQVSEEAGGEAQALCLKSGKPEGAGLPWQPRQSALTYSGYDNGLVAVEYLPGAEGVKENLYLESKEAEKDFWYCLQVKGLCVRLTEAGEVQFSEETTGEVKYRFEAPFMRDAAGEISRDITCELFSGKTLEPVSGPEEEAEEEGLYYLHLTADEEWLSEASYPVVIDPVLKRPVAGQISDAGSVSESGTVSGELYAGRNSEGVFRSFLRFRLPTLPAQSVVTEAILDLKGNPDEEDTHYLQASLLTEPWYYQGEEQEGERLSWESQPTRGAVLDYCVNGSYFNIMEGILGWLEGTCENYGIAICAVDETVREREKVTLQTDRTAFPYLKITYRVAVGLESYWGTHSVGAGTAGAGSINDYTGALTVAEESVVTAGNRMPMAITHVYNSNGEEGKKWHLNYEETIRIPLEGTALGTYPYVYTDSDGTEHYFKKQAVTYQLNGAEKQVELPATDTAYPPAADEDGLKLYIVSVTDGELKKTCPLKLIDKSSGSIRYFDALGRLTMVDDGNRQEHAAGTDTRVSNRVTIRYESSGEALPLTAFDEFLAAAETLKTLSDRADFAPGEASLKEALETLSGAFETLRKDPYAKGDYFTGLHVYRMGKALAELTETEGVPEKTLMRTNAATLVTEARLAKERAGELTGISSMRIGSILDGVGREAVFTYDSTAQGSLPVSITDPAFGGAVSFSYTEDGLIECVTYPDGRKGSYTYNDRGLMTSQEDTEGYRISYTYEGDRVSGVRESRGEITGQTYGITYQRDNTTVFRFSGVDEEYGNEDDILNIHVFDEQGRTLCVYSRRVDEEQVIGSCACTYQKENSSGSGRNRIKDSAVVGMHANNLLVNHSFEYGDETWSLYREGKEAAGDLSRHSPGAHYLGVYSAMADLSKAGGRKGFSQTQTLPAGTYTFSCYIRAVGLKGGEACLRAVTGDGSDPAAETFQSSPVSQSTDPLFDNGWERKELTFTLSGEQQVTFYLETERGQEQGAGKVYFDCVQLETGAVANAYNLLEDGSFERTEGTLPYQWSATTAAVKVPDERVAGGVDGAYCYRITGQPGKNKYLRFTTNLGGSKNGYVLSGFVKSTAAPVREGRTFQVMAKCDTKDEEGQDVTLQVVNPLHTGTEGWQYFCLLLPAKKWTSTAFTLCFYDMLGEVSVDGLQLTRNDVQTKTYDASGNLSGSYTALKTDRYTHDSYNRVKTHVTPSGASYSYTYDGNNAVRKQTAGIGPDTYYTYDDYGNLTASRSFASGQTSATATQFYSAGTYTEDGNFPESTTDSTGSTTGYAYDRDKGQLLSVTLPARGEEEPVVVSYQYDSRDRTTGVRQADREIGFTYGDFEDVTGITHNGFTYGFTYDAFGNVLTTSIAGRVISTNTYGPENGSLEKTTLADGTVLENSYDRYGHITEKRINDQPVTSYLFDNDGKLSRQKDLTAGLITQYHYNDAGKVVRSEVYGENTGVAGSPLSRLQYTYTGGGLIGGISYQEKGEAVKTYTYTYDKDELPVKSSHPDTSTTQWTYDSLRRNTRTVFAPKSGAADSKKLYTTLGYASARQTIDGKQKTTTTGQVSTYSNRFGSNGTVLSRYDYTYDTWGNITGITRQDKSGTRNRSYTYNEYGEVTGAEETYGDGTSVSYTYSYDAGGNLVTEQAGEVTHSYVYDSCWKDQLVSYDGQAITYDAAGHPLEYLGKTMTWNENGKLASVSAEDSVISYTYLATGERSSKTSEGIATTYQYNNGLLLSETTGDETLYYYYDSTGRVVSIGYRKGEGEETGYFFTRNLQGDIIGVYRSSDSRQVGSYEYDLWGRLVGVTEAEEGIDTEGILEKNPIRYRGYYYDAETGFYYLNARYYDPQIRRFISADEVGYLGLEDSIAGYNLFAYCNNNPIMHSDPSGHSIILACIIVGAVIGGLAGGHIAAKVSKAQTGKVNGWAVAGGIVGGGAIGSLVGWGVGAAITAIGAAATGAAGTAAAPVVEQAAEKASTALQTYYPPNNGFSGAIERISLDVGTVIQRTGDLAGRFTAPAGTPSQMLSLPYDKIGQATTYLQTTQPIQALSGTVAPWFGQIGGGTQYLLLDGRVDQLLAEGILKIFGE